MMTIITPLEGTGIETGHGTADARGTGTIAVEVEIGTVVQGQMILVPGTVD
jgi:hypothetical protein